MYILLDTEKYNSPTATNNILETFFNLKKEVLISLENIKEKLDNLDGIIFIVIKPADGIKIAFLHFEEDIIKEINNLLNQSFDVSKIAANFLNANNN